MNFKQINLKSLTVFLAMGIALGACNLGTSTEKIADTASTPAYTSTDTMAAAPAATSADTAASSMTAADTSAKVSSKSTGSTSTASLKKKGKAKIMLEPAAKNAKIEKDKAGIYSYAEMSPSFPGGQNGLDNYINNNIEYPQTALDDSKEGRIGVSFVIDENGKVTDVHDMGTKIGYGLDEEAVRVVSNMPKWTPGMVKGKPVKTRMTLPIVFQVEQ